MAGIFKTANGFYGQVVVGNSAKFLGKKAQPEQTHEWTCYLRGVRGADVSAWVSRVDFHLHPSFANPVRSFARPPYEVTERGWGEFEIVVHVFFHDVNEEPVQFIHQLRLYEDVTAPPNPKKLVQIDRIEDIIFSAQISPDFRAILERCARLPALAASSSSSLAPSSAGGASAAAHAAAAAAAAASVAAGAAGSSSSAPYKKRRHLDVAVDESALTAPEKAELDTLKEASKKVLEHIKLLRNAYVQADAQVDALRKSIAAAEKQLQAGATAAAAAATTTATTPAGPATTATTTMVAAVASQHPVVTTIKTEPQV